MAEETVTDEPLTEAEVLEAGPVIEAEQRVVVPKKGKLFEEDGSVGIAVIRPCVSRGKRIRGLPPIYTPRMLAEHISVFKGWPMFMDHLSEEMIEALRERQRSIRELGGRIIKTWYDPEFKTEEDEERGWRVGAGLARAIPQPPVRSMLEADPQILNTSINCWPTGGKPGFAPWNKTLRGMLIEGFRSEPRGSVDWVLRGGAGGHVLQEDLDLAVSLIESYYDAASEDMDWSKITSLEGLKEELKANKPELLEQLEADAPEPKPAAKPKRTTRVRESEEDEPAGISEDELNERLEEQRKTLSAEWDTKLQERDDEVEERAQELVTERDMARAHERIARDMISEAKLPATWTQDLQRRYSVLPSGPSQALLTEAETVQEDGKDVSLTEEQVLRRRVEADIKHANKLIEEAGGGPRVSGLGPSRRDPGAQPAGRERGKPAWQDASPIKLSEEEKDGKKAQEAEDDAISEMVREGVSL